jgi:hypothetical protein
MPESFDSVIDSPKKVIAVNIVINLFAGIVVIPFIFFSFIAIGSGDMRVVCLVIDGMFFGLLCAVMAFWCAKRSPKLFWLWPVLFSAPSLGLMSIIVVDVFISKEDPMVLVVLVTPLVMLVNGLVAGGLGYYIRKVKG